VHLSLTQAGAGLVVGFVVGLTGMGGGALMTPILVVFFHVQALAAVSSDVVASLVMKPFGASIHLRRGTVRTDLVRWLVIGSVPSAFAGVILLRVLGDGDVNGFLKPALGVTLIVAAGAMVAKSVLERRPTRQLVTVGAPGADEGPARRSIVVMPLPTIAIGALGGLVVGMTSVGSGSLIIVLLLVLYPSLTASELVGTDLIQAIPLVGAAALGHLLLGDAKLALIGSLLLGAIPGVVVGAHLSSRAPSRVIKPLLAVVLVGSGIKLLAG
jgi:uncharacterized membrane protein YfcA